MYISKESEKTYPRCPREVELEGYFGQYGELDDVYVPGKAHL